MILPNVYWIKVLDDDKMWVMGFMGLFNKRNDSVKLTVQFLFNTRMSLQSVCQWKVNDVNKKSTFFASYETLCEVFLEWIYKAL